MTPYGVVYAPEAADQLEELYHYIAERRSAAVAERFTNAVIEACESLALFPLRGVLREDIRPGLRVTNHQDRTVIAYAVDQEARRVSILGVLYGGQGLAQALAEGRDA